jgi:hypothetical protein
MDNDTYIIQRTHERIKELKEILEKAEALNHKVTVSHTEHTLMVNEALLKAFFERTRF